MNKVANTYWVDPRLAAQRPAARALKLMTPAPDGSRDILAAAAAATHAATTVTIARPRAAARRSRGQLVPSWVIFGMIILATFALCVTVTMRTRAEMRTAEQRFERISTDVERLRNANRTIEREIEQLRTDPRAIEAAARARLNMVRAGEIVVPVE
ncbi:MAG: septum formation initiator family protein [Acidobacteria bacterium]|nr:septum formation initiator family protein [Acidobacteriota bacterium]